MDHFTSQIEELKIQMDSHEIKLSRLMNRTSNADVLDRLEEYKGYVAVSIESVETSLQRASLNFANLLNDDHNTLNALASNISTELSSTMLMTHARINSSLESTQNEVKNSLHTALLKSNFYTIYIQLPLLSHYNYIICSF
jgi:hypothetical protein